MSPGAASAGTASPAAVAEVKASRSLRIGEVANIAGILFSRFEDQQPTIEVDNPLPKCGWFGCYGLGLKAQRTPFQEPRNPYRKFVRLGDIGGSGHGQGAVVEASDLRGDIDGPR